MFFKKKQWVAPSWWAAFNRKQNEYARQLANFLGRLVAKVPLARLRVQVTLILMTMIGYEFGTVIQSIKEPQIQNQSNVFGRPNRLILPVSRKPASGKGFGLYLDSLQHDPMIRKELDSLLKTRPGLADTLRQLERMTR
jgi:hypothetical protein